jgi:hypothetical protein
MSALQSDLHAASHVAICITSPEAQIQFYRLGFHMAHRTQDYYMSLNTALIFRYNFVPKHSRL